MKKDPFPQNVAGRSPDPKLPQGWRWTRLDEAAEITMGNSPPGESYNDNGDGVPLINGPVEFSDGDLGLTVRSKYTTSPTKLCRTGDFLICVRGSTTGRTNVAAFDACIGRGVTAIRANGHQGFLNHYLRTLRRRLYDSGKGSTFPSISQGQLAEIHIPLAPLSEQRRIAAILDKADALRRKRQQALQLTERFLRSTFLDMFGDPVTNPKGWRESPLGAVADIQSGVTKGRKFNGRETVSVPYMRVANVQDGHLILDVVKEIEVLREEIQRFRLLPGDVLLTEGGDFDKLGRGAVWRGEIDPCIHQNHIFRVRPSSERVLPEFLSALLGSRRGKGYFLRAAKQTTGIATINKTQLSGFPALLPPLSLQRTFEELVARHCQLMARLQGRFGLVDTLFEALAQRAFRGEL